MWCAKPKLWAIRRVSSIQGSFDAREGRDAMPDSSHAVLQPKHANQRRLIAFDGGGIRGLITLGILEQIEADLRTASGTGDRFRLSDYFNFVGARRPEPYLHQDSRLDFLLHNFS